MKAHGDVDARVHMYTATALGIGRATNLRSDAFTPWKSPVLIIRDRVDPRNSLDTKERRKCPPFRHPGSNPGRPARSQAPCRLSYWSLLRKTVTGGICPDWQYEYD